MTSTCSRSGGDRGALDGGDRCRDPGRRELERIPVRGRPRHRCGGRPGGAGRLPDQTVSRATRAPSSPPPVSPCMRSWVTCRRPRWGVIPIADGASVPRPRLGREHPVSPSTSASPAANSELYALDPANRRRHPDRRHRSGPESRAWRLRPAVSSTAGGINNGPLQHRPGHRAGDPGGGGQHQHPGARAPHRRNPDRGGEHPGRDHVVRPLRDRACHRCADAESARPVRTCAALAPAAVLRRRFSSPAAPTAGR